MLEEELTAPWKSGNDWEETLGEDGEETAPEEETPEVEEETDDEENFE